jgi:hypothetical protein
METGKKLPCGHLFHGVPCLRSWLEEATFCPLCKAPIDEDEYKKYLAERTPNPTRSETLIQPENIQQRVNEIYENVFQQYGISLNNQQGGIVGGEEEVLFYNQEEEVEFEKKQELKEKNDNQVDSQEDSFSRDNVEIIKIQEDASRMNPTSEVDKIMADMYIRHLENYKKLMDETIQKLKLVRDK